jgi:hypothetical protein
MEYDVHHAKFKHPFTCLISGPTQSGKTTLIRRILKNYRLLFHNINTTTLKVLWIYGQWQPNYNLPIGENIIVRFTQNIPDFDKLDEYKPHVIVIDDFLNEFDKNKNLENIFIKQSHHLDISVFFLVQNLFHKSIRTISLNSQYIILLKNPRDGAQIRSLAKQIYPLKSNILVEAFLDATKQPYGYLVIDLKSDTPDSLRLRTRINPEEVHHLNKRFSPIIYRTK